MAGSGGRPLRQVAGAAEALSIGERTIRELKDRGELRCKKLGARVLILRTDLEAFAANLPDWEAPEW